MSDTTTLPDDTTEIQVTNPWREMRTMFFRNYAAVAGLILLIAILVFVFIGPLIHTTDPFEMSGPLSPCRCRRGSSWARTIWVAIYCQR